MTRSKRCSLRFALRGRQLRFALLRVHPGKCLNCPLLAGESTSRGIVDGAMVTPEFRARLDDLFVDLDCHGACPLLQIALDCEYMNDFAGAWTALCRHGGSKCQYGL